MRYQLYYPTPNERGSTMLDYIMDEEPQSREYRKMDEGEIPGPDALSGLWYRYNMGNEDGSYRYQFRSMCIGDIIVFPDLNHVCMVARDGFLPLDKANLPRGVVI